MITWKKSYESNPVFVGVLIFLMVIFSMQFTLIPGGVTLLNPVLGVALVLAWVFGKDVYPAIGFGALIGQFFMRFFIYDILLMQSLFLAVFLTLILMMQIEIAMRLALRFNLKELEYRFAFKTTVLFVLVSLFIAILGAYFGNISLIITSVSNAGFVRTFLVYAFGDFMAILILVPSGILGYRFDKEILFSKQNFALLKTVLFFTLFAWLTILLVNDIGFFVFERHKYLVILFYITIGFLFSYRTIHYFTLTFLLGAALFHAPRLDQIEMIRFYVSLIIFMGFSTMITLFIKRFHDIRMRQAHEVENQNAALDLLLTEVYALLELSSDMIDSNNPNDRNYLTRTFDIAYVLFKGIDAGYCYQLIDGRIELVDTRIYSKDDVPYMYETQQLIDDDPDTLYIYDDIKTTLQNLFGEQFGILDDEKYPIKSRIIIPLYYQDDEAFIIVLDKFNHREAIDKVQFDRLKHFSYLLDGLYKRNYFVLRNTNLKDEIVLSIVRTLELYDPYTRGHSEDVAHLAVELARALNKDSRFIAELYWAGILHDIGKVGVDSKVINKPAKLTQEEYELVKAHSNYGFDVLSKASSLNPIAAIVKHHHEWFDGSGYPTGLSAEAIPLASRMISVVDTVATMATDRPYRARQSKARIKEELVKGKGTQFDPILVDKMIELIDRNILEGHFKRNYH